MINRLAVIAGACALAALAIGRADASPITYVADLAPLNDSGVHAHFKLVLDGDLLTVTEHATGLEAGKVHVQHIHGVPPPNAADTKLASPSDDTNHDGYIDLLEGKASYGPILLQLSSPPGGALGDFPTAPTGTITFSQTYNLADPSQFGTTFTEADLLPLTEREIVIHGLTVGPDYVDSDPASDPLAGTTHYVATLPVADGFIRAVPEPASLALLVVGLTGCWMVRRARQ